MYSRLKRKGHNIKNNLKIQGFQIDYVISPSFELLIYENYIYRCIKIKGDTNLWTRAVIDFSSLIDREIGNARYIKYLPYEHFSLNKDVES